MFDLTFIIHSILIVITNGSLLAMLVETDMNNELKEYSQKILFIYSNDQVMDELNTQLTKITATSIGLHSPLYTFKLVHPVLEFAQNGYGSIYIKKNH